MSPDPRSFSNVVEAVEAWELERSHLRHDLRSKVGVILGVTDILLSAEEAPLSPSQHHQVTLVHRAAQDLLAIVERSLERRKEPV
jgi:signal transduction histidine kinase